MERQTSTTARGLTIPTSAVFFLLLSIYTGTYHTCHSFQPSTSFFSTTRSPSPESNSPTRNNGNRQFSMHTRFYTDPSSTNVHDQTPPKPSFEQRMREQLMRHQSSNAPVAPKDATSRKTLVPDVRTLNDFKGVLDRTAENEKMLAVLWYSPWCKACKATLPGIRTLAKRHPDVQFIQVPVLTENANLHQGLDVPSVPFLHLYTPEDPRLVEELKMTRKKLSGFQKLLLDYERGFCSLEQLHAVTKGEGESESDEPGKPLWSTASPYSSTKSTTTTTTPGAAAKME